MKNKIKRMGIICFALIVLCCNIVLASTPAETITDMTNNINILLQIVKANEPRITISDFTNECNRYVKAQLDYLQVMPYWESPNAGGRIWCSKVQDGTTTAYGYRISRIDGSNCLDRLLESNSQPLYHVVISFGDSGWGHVCYIYAIVDNQVYFTDNWTYRGSNLVAFQPVVLDINTFKNYEVSSNGNMNSLLYFFKETSTIQEGWDDSLGFWRYHLSNGTYAKNQFIDLGRDQKYYFRDDTSMVENDWIQVAGKYYHAAADGHMDLGWQNFNGEWYYFNDPSGDMKTNGWEEYDGKKYYLSASGPRYRNITKTIDGKTYNFNADGVAEVVSNSTSTKASTLKITGTTKPNTLYQGDFFGLDGTISSNYLIERVDGMITDKNGYLVQSISVCPNSTEYRLYPEIDSALIFNDLSVGSYYYIVIAKDASGTEKELIKKSFSVKDSRQNSKLKITGATKPSKIREGNFFGLDGTITSNYSITEVYGAIQKTNGDVVQEVTVYPNVTEYRLNTVIDNSLIFNYLEQGNYKYVIIATDSSGNQKKLINQSFKVVK